MIGVGINENVVIERASINDKGRLTLALREAGKKQLSVFEAMTSAGVTEDETFNLQLFGFNVPNIPGKELTDLEKAEISSEDMKKLKNQLEQILEQFLTTDQIIWNTYEGTGITNENFLQRLLDQEVLNRVYKNLAEDFIRMVEPFTGKDEFAVRLKLQRQSKDKHFATLPSRFIKNSPFIELMDVPKENSRIGWSKWEKENGMDDGTPVSRSTADTTASAPSVGGESSVFQSR